MSYATDKNPDRAKSGQIITKSDRGAFWVYCKQTAGAARARSIAKNVPCDIDAHFIDGLLVDQKWRCAVSGVPLTPPNVTGREFRKDPFAPSLDRIIPNFGYVAGNVRVVSNIVNSAMNEWGLDNLLILIDSMTKEAP